MKSKMAVRFHSTRTLARNTSIYVCLILIFLLQLCLALYEDQVGLFDWRQQYIGKVKFAYFDQYSHSSRRAWVATHSNVIAALNARTGSIIWRKVFEDKSGRVDSLLHHANALISISGYGKVLRSWDPNKGHLQWEITHHDTTDHLKDNTINGLPKWGAALVHKKIGSSNAGVAILSTNGVRFLRVRDGAEIWNWKPELGTQEMKDATCVGMLASVDNIFIIMQKNQIFIEVITLSPETGTVQGRKTIPAPWLSHETTNCLLVGTRHLICLDSQKSNLVSIDLAANGEGVTTTPVQTLADGEILLNGSLEHLGNQLDRNDFIFKINGKVQLLIRIEKDGKTLTMIRKFSQDVYLTASSMSSYNILMSVKSSESSMTIQIFDLDDFKELEKLKQVVNFDGVHGEPEFGTIYAFSKKDNELGYRLLMAFQDHNLCLIQQSGTVLWNREEALAGITSVEMIELPAATSASKLELLHEEFAAVPNAGILSMFMKRVKVQLKQLEVFMASLKKRKHYDMQSGQQREHTDDLTRDQFGLHKIIVAVTDSGKLFGLDSTRGKILWSRFLPDLSPFHSKDGETTMLFVQRGTAHFPLPPQCVVVGKKKSGKGTLVFAFNPLTGKPADKQNPNGIVFSFDIVQVSLLPLTDEKFSKTILLIDDDLKIHIFPETEESVSHLQEKINSIYLHLIDQDTNKIKGYMLREVKGGGKGMAQINEAWTVKFPEDQVIHRIVSKRLDEHVHSVGRVLGDRSVLYKYLNPNLIAFATVTEDTAKPAISLYVIDGVTGQIVYQARHRNSKGPMQMVLSENWLVYLYYNNKARRSEISVVEMFEGFEERNNTAFSSLESLDHPMILSQGYLLPVTRVSAMAATNTERGITHKNLMLALESGYIYTIPKNMLDPRRSFSQTAELAEEGLMPYVPEIPLYPMAYVNYNMTVDKIRGIHTASAGLESTSLVLAYGLDLYFTRVTPSRKFDVLKEDFDYIFISGVLSALILGTIISSKLASIRKLNLSWL